MAQALHFIFRRDESPFQLYSDLRCPSLRDFHPISQAAHSAKEREKQRQQGIIPLAELKQIA